MRKKRKPCLLIQWGALHTINGQPACPQCGEPAEAILAFMGEPGWAHKPLASREGKP